jgi:molybdenum cofactor cytidylyltransferase
MAPEPTRRVAGIVLAAGASSRMGAPKLLLDFGGETLLRRAVRTALAAGLDPVLVVVGPEAEQARRELAGLPCAMAENPQPVRGKGSSVTAGVAGLPPDVGAAVVMLPDMPRVTAAMIAALAARWSETGSPLVVSDYAGTIAPPVLFARPLFGELAAAGGEHPGKVLLARHRADAEVVRCPAAALADIDTPDDLVEG